ncbi:MAG: 50S ribosomal protein L4 [Candidatus Sungbacteria bacterium]|nr:50S ribosomal protein L4 [Candidatus Sungbacteria bacterium]
MQVKVYNQTGEEAGTVELPDGVFGLKWNADLVHQVVTSQAANRRSGTAHTKSRAEVRGGGRKPWRQKGTGRARHGSTRSPIWKGGGITHGPRVEKNYEKKINKKMAKKALSVVLSAKARDRELVVMDDLNFPEAKTKHAAQMFRKLSGQNELAELAKNKSILVALFGKDDTTRRAMRNISRVTVDEARNLNTYEVMQHKFLMLPKAAIEILAK